jgi:hypothetical protein
MRSLAPNTQKFNLIRNVFGKYIKLKMLLQKMSCRAAKPSVFSVFNPEFPRNFESSPESSPSIIPLGILKVFCQNTEKS